MYLPAGTRGLLLRQLFQLDRRACSLKPHRRSVERKACSLSLLWSPVCLSPSVCLSVSLFFPSLFLPLSLPLFSVSASASLCMCFSLSFSPSFHTERHLNVSPFLALTSCYHTACSTALRPQGECDSLIFAAIWRNIHRGVLLCVSLCECILNCPRQATREWRLKASCPWRTWEEDGLLFRNTAAASAASWARSCQDASSPTAVSFVRH